ncbi:probable E3 ubiquitin-protein ligase RHA4A [Benincasa hispida]|uniref:probable E3 ubiquitin-protein ligase RHA4A n=1 Tax=Benincasa hispida TaxID=102211 RepID=UPI00190058C7|nr:probable E3 ubiquitin-protein ligase RHA4A [Benincasa hispida]
MLGFIFLNSPVRFLRILLFYLNQAILAVATLFRRGSLPEFDNSDAGTLLVRTYEELQRNDDDRPKEEEICSICLMEFAREDSVYELPDCKHVYHFNCIEKWLERNRFTCPLCRCFFFNIKNRHEKKNNTNLCFVVPDNPSCLYYFLQ